MTRAPRRTLAWRLYVLGLVQLVLLGGAVVGVGYLLRPEIPPRSDFVASDHPPPAPPPGGLSLGPPPDEPPHGGPPRDRPARDEAREEAREGPRVSPPPGPSPHHHEGGHGRWPGPLVTFFFSGLVILGIGSILTARWIVRPLEQLSRAAKTLGDGDLRARTGLTRDDELGDLGRAFDDMAERLERLRKAERELLANVSHELRTPLARIRVALDIAGEGDAEVGRLSISEIGLALQELEELIDDILTAARLETAEGKPSAAGFALHREPIEPSVLSARAGERFRGRHPARPFESRVASDLPLVDADPVLFRRVLDNILENSHKYSPDPKRPIALHVAPATKPPSGVAFEVTDAGMGIGPEDLPHVFTPFFRAERSRSRGTGGVGLGLTLAKRIVEAHGGTIEVESAVGVGTTVRLVLPGLVPSEGMERAEQAVGVSPRG